MDEISEVKRSKQQAKTSYSKLSNIYDIIADPFERKFKLICLDMLQVKPGDTALEVGFGTGSNLIRLTEMVGDAGTVHGIDIAEGMYDRATSKIRHRHLEDRITLSLGDATSLPYDDNTFDIVFMSFVLELFAIDEIPLVLSECMRVLKSNGQIGAVSLRKRDRLMVRLYEWFHERMPSMLDCRPIYPKRSIQEAGFAIEECVEKSMFTLPVEIVVGVKPAEANL
jgi:demethylmenaquinone methyltransferase/2-methoxy-6-polyprenyl-1,4-benzoquinol methylase